MATGLKVHLNQSCCRHNVPASSATTSRLPKEPTSYVCTLWKLNLESAIARVAEKLQGCSVCRLTEWMQYRGLTRLLKPADRTVCWSGSSKTWLRQPTENCI